MFCLLKTHGEPLQSYCRTALAPFKDDWQKPALPVRVRPVRPDQHSRVLVVHTHVSLGLDMDEGSGLTGLRGCQPGAEGVEV